MQVYEVLDNSIDEVQGGYARNVRVSVAVVSQQGAAWTVAFVLQRALFSLQVELDLSSGLVRIKDDGRGIPTDIHPATGKSAMETVLTVLHAGGKFGGADSGYTVSGGLHGVGISVVNALSESLTITVW